MPRAETVDTAVIGVSSARGPLEELLLSLWEDVNEKYDDPQFSKEFIDTFNITFAYIFD